MIHYKNMKSIIKELKLVRDFHKKFNVPISDKPALINKDRYDLRYKLMKDEIEEYKQGTENVDPENIAKELADILYATYGTILEHGLQDVIGEVFEEVHNSNMSKDYSQYKMVKGESYFDANIKKILKAKSMDKGCYYNHGLSNEIAFVFSVPGKLELYNGRPVAGQTGVLLEELMDILYNKEKDLFREIDFERKTKRYDYRITNAYPYPLYMAKDNRTQAIDKEIMKKENIDRLLEELKDIEKYIFVFGKKACKAIQEVKNRKKNGSKVFKERHPKIITERHLGLMSVNQIDKDVNKNPILSGGKNNTEKRLEVIAENIIDKIGK